MSTPNSGKIQRATKSLFRTHGNFRRSIRATRRGRPILALFKPCGPAVTKFRGHVGESTQTLCEALEFEKELNLKIERLYHYASLRSPRRVPMPLISGAKACSKTCLPRSARHRLCRSPKSRRSTTPPSSVSWPIRSWGPWRISCDKYAPLKPHTLTAGEERLVALGASRFTATATPSAAYNVDMKFGSLKDEKGEERALAKAPFRPSW